MPRYADDRGATFDAALLARFAKYYEGDDDPADAIHWLTDPESPGPSGAPSPTDALDRAREQLYRPDAGEAALRRFQELTDRVAEQQDAAARALALAQRTASMSRGSASSTARHPRWWGRRRAQFTVLGIAVLVIPAVLVLGALLTPTSVVVKMTPLRMLSSTSDPASKEAAVLSLFAGSFPAENQLSLRTVFDRPPALALGGVQLVAVKRMIGSAVLASPDSERVTSGSVTVLVLCTTASAYRWVVTGEDASGHERVLATSSESGCRGTAAYATVFLDDEKVGALRLSTRSADRVLTAVIVAPAHP